MMKAHNAEQRAVELQPQGHTTTPQTQPQPQFTFNRDELLKRCTGAMQ